MGKRNKLADVDAAEIAASVNKNGQAQAAAKYDVSQSGVSKYLRRHGYRAVTLYLDAGETVTITPTGASVPFAVVDGEGGQS